MYIIYSLHAKKKILKPGTICLINFYAWLGQYLYKSIIMWRCTFNINVFSAVHKIIFIEESTI